MCFGEVGLSSYLYDILPPLNFFALMTWKEYLKPNIECLPYIASVLAERLVQLIKHPTLFKTILKSPKLNVWDNSAAVMSNSLG